MTEDEEETWECLCRRTDQVGPDAIAEEVLRRLGPDWYLTWKGSLHDWIYNCSRTVIKVSRRYALKDFDDVAGINEFGEELKTQAQKKLGWDLDVFRVDSPMDPVTYDIVYTLRIQKINEVTPR